MTASSSTHLSVDQLAEEMGIDPDKFDRQCQLEMDSYELGIDRYSALVNSVHGNTYKDNTSLKVENAMLRKYIKNLSMHIRTKVMRFGRGSSPMVRDAKVFLRSPDADRLAYTTLQFCFNIDDSNHNLTNRCVSLGRRIEKDWEYTMFQEKAKGYLTKVERNLKSKHMRHRHNVLNHASKKVQIKDKKTGEVIGVGIPKLNWVGDMAFVVGKLLLEAATESTDLFAKTTRTVRKKDILADTFIIERTPKCRKFVEEGHLHMQDMKPLHYPMIIPPKPWTGVRGGGFWTQYKTMGTRLLRTRKGSVLRRAAEGGVERVCAAINAVQATKYRINRPILDVMREAKSMGIAKLPADDKFRVKVNDHHPLEEPCPWTDTEIKVLKKQKDPRWIAWTRDRAQAYDIFHREIGKRQALLWKLKIAEEFKDEPEIYFTANCDYRGRVNFYQPFLHPQADDSGRGLLEFADGKVMTEEGFYWLCIHGANEFGFDKAPLPERIQWVKDNHAKIMESAENPLDGSRWWSDCDKPFQFLAFAFEYAGYVRAREAGTEFWTHLPCQVDGTCSGLQHYSALLRDMTGARAVNLIPSDKKADVYGEVAVEANEILIRDASAVVDADDKEGGDRKEFAKAWLSVGVGRSEAKRNTMTFCYGATRAGFGQQIIDYVTKEGIRFPDGIDTFRCCNYLGGVNWEAVSRVLVKSVEAMAYVQEIAYFMAKENQTNIHWTSPIGLVVTQDYLKTQTKQIKTWWGGVRIDPAYVAETKEKNPVGSRNGIAPNLIHSFDASHLMLMTLECHRRGINAFSLIHDSFGTHCTDLPVMNRVLRETFVEMYSEDLLEKWTAEVRSQVKPELLDDFDAIVARLRPAPGTLDVSVVLESPYFFC